MTFSHRSLNFCVNCLSMARTQLNIFWFNQITCGRTNSNEYPPTPNVMDRDILNENSSYSEMNPSLRNPGSSYGKLTEHGTHHVSKYQQLAVAGNRPETVCSQGPAQSLKSKGTHSAAKVKQITEVHQQHHHNVTKSASK